MGLRDAVVLAIVAASLPLAMLRPFFGLLVFSWLAYMRPNDMAWTVNDYHPSLLVAVATVFGVVRSPDERFAVLEKRTFLLALLLTTIGTAALLAPDPVRSFHDGNLADLAKVLFIAVLTTGLVSTRDRARWLLLVIAVSFGVLALKSSVQGVLRPADIQHGPGGSIRDNNDYGLALVMAIPLLAYLARDERRPLLRAALAGMAVACVAGVLFTQSRGGVVALGVVSLVWIFKLRRNPWALILAPLAVALTVVVSPPEVWVRVRSLATGVADAAAQNRVLAWQKGLNMWSQNKLFGVGPGNFTDPVLWYATPPSAPGVKPLVAHNTCIQILAESGAVAFAVFLALLVVTLVALARTRPDPQHPWRARYADAVFLSLVGFLAGSFFLSRTHFDLTYHLVGISVALRVATDSPEFDWFGVPRWWARRCERGHAGLEGRSA